VGDRQRQRGALVAAKRHAQALEARNNLLLPFIANSRLIGWCNLATVGLGNQAVLEFVAGLK
jgi:hypothetical protein